MPLIKSAEKRRRQTIVRQARLQPVRTSMKTMFRKVTDAVKEGKMQEAIALIPQAQKAIDMAVKKGVLHHKTGDRRKSLLARLVAPKKS